MYIYICQMCRCVGVTSGKKNKQTKTWDTQTKWMREKGKGTWEIKIENLIERKRERSHIKDNEQKLERLRGLWEREWMSLRATEKWEIIKENERRWDRERRGREREKGREKERERNKRGNRMREDERRRDRVREGERERERKGKQHERGWRKER